MMRWWFGTAVALTVCCGQAQAFSFGGGDASAICLLHDATSASGKCHDGEVLLYQPRSFGNAQLPIIISAAFCDFGHPIVYNEGGVSCIFTEKRKGSWGKLGVGAR